MKLHALIFAAGLFLVSACSTVGNLSVLDRDETPRSAAVSVSGDITTALKEISLICEAGGVSQDLAATIVQHAPPVIEVAEEYFASAEDCVVIDGALVDDPASAGNCQRGSVRKVTQRFPSVLAQAAGEFGLDTRTGLALYLAGRAVDRYSGNNDGGYIDGFQKDDELNRDQYIDALAPLRDARDRASLCITRAAEG
jgi:hypothetical protein